MNDLTAFARLILAIEPWRAHLVLAGGWAHRLHRFHPLARTVSYQPLATRDTDIVFGTDAPLEGDMREALMNAGFKEELSGEHKPPVTHYSLGAEGAGFYAEFLTPLVGSEVKNGKVDATVVRGGVTARKLRHLDLLLVEPWPIRIGTDQGVPLPKPVDVLVVNPAAFIVQTLLIHKYRGAAKQAQDVLYIHDTIELFGNALPTLQDLWNGFLAPALGSRTAKRVADVADAAFSAVTDVVRAAARIPQDRELPPDRLRSLCEVGLKRILG